MRSFIRRLTSKNREHGGMYTFLMCEMRIDI
jgi:hypothetical protein